jgi:hypothetical protein
MISKKTLNKNKINLSIKKMHLFYNIQFKIDFIISIEEEKTFDIFNCNYNELFMYFKI